MIDDKRWQEIDEKEPIPSHILERMVKDIRLLFSGDEEKVDPIPEVGSNVHHRLKVSEKLAKSIQVF